jgi:hypothetical protein
MKNDSQSIVAELQKASEGLLFMSESDYPFKTFLWEGCAGEPLSKDRLLSLTGHSPGQSVETIDLDDLFHVAIKDQDWHGPKEREAVKKYRELVALLKEKLLNIVVYRIGQVEIDVYIIGSTESGDLAGLSTRVIET